MTKLQQAILFVDQAFPDASGDNTELYIKLLELYCHRRGRDVPREVLDFIRSYKPETVTRERRKLINATDPQRNKEDEFRNKYK